MPVKVSTDDKEVLEYTDSQAKTTIGAGQNWEKLKTVSNILTTVLPLSLIQTKTLPKGETSATAEKRKKRREWHEANGTSGRKRGLNGVKAFMPPPILEDRS